MVDNAVQQNEVLEKLLYMGESYALGVQRLSLSKGIVNALRQERKRMALFVRRVCITSNLYGGAWIRGYNRRTVLRGITSVCYSSQLHHDTRADSL